MHYFLIHKYDFDNSDYAQEWTTLSKLLQETGEAGPSTSYLRLEREFLDVVVQFLRTYDHLPLTYRFCYIIDDDLLSAADAAWLQDLLLPLHETVTLVQTGRFEDLSFIERLAVFQLAVRAEVHVAIEDPATGVVLSTVDDGFYWYVALLDDTEPEMLVRSSRLFINYSIDIFDEA